MRKRKHNIAFKPIIGLAVFFFIMLVAGVYFSGVLKRLSFFTVNEIVIRQPEAVKSSSVDLSYLKGRNIFTIDLEREEQFLNQLYPGYKKIKLIRLLPNRLFVDFVKRQPLAYVKLYRTFCVDQDQVLFAADFANALNIPVITGLETRIFGPRIGARYNIKGLFVAIEIIKAVKANKALKNLTINKINVKDFVNASFFIFLPEGAQNNNKGKITVGNYFEIKIGQDFISDKVNIMASLFTAEKKNWQDIKYIDLRFKEPVIKLNTKEKKN